MTHIRETRRAGGAAGLDKSSLACRLGQAKITRNSVSAQAQSLRLKYLAGQLHALGPAPLAYFLNDIEGGADIRATLEAYASLPAEFIRAYGGYVFAPSLWLLDEGGTP